MQRVLIILGILTASLSGCTTKQPEPGAEALRQQVIATEQAFAATMADRNLAGFISFLSEETVFFSGPKPLRGAKAVVEWWQKYYQGASAPFSWAPEQVEVLDSGSLALSSGPVYDREGKLTGTFTSIWRLESPGKWRIIFDKGCPVCD